MSNDPGEISRTVIDAGSEIKIETDGEGVGEYREMDTLISKYFLNGTIFARLK